MASRRAKYEKTRDKAAKGAEKRIKKTVKQALKGKRDITSVVKQVEEEKSDLAGVFKPRIIIKGVYKEGK